jgi:hypothetical protein
VIATALLTCRPLSTQSGRWKNLSYGPRHEINASPPFHRRHHAQTPPAHSLLFLDRIEFAPEPPPDDADIAWPGASDDEE